MSENLFLVFSKPPASLPEGQFHTWYEDHIRENLLTPGFRAARRYAVETIPDRGDVSFPYNHLAIYEFAGAWRKLRASLDQRIQAGEIVLPTWHDDVRFANWNCTALGERVEPAQ
jgi:hypothetical protein